MPAITITATMSHRTSSDPDNVTRSSSIMSLRAKNFLSSIGGKS
jgi:hypothetical protein